MKRQSLVLLFIIASFNLFSQKGLFPGYYINNNGDSIKCQVRYKDWYKNPVSVEFVIDGTTKVFGVNDITGFGVFKYGHYKNEKVTIHLNPISGRDLPFEFSDDIKSENYFLKRIVLGKYSLYQLVTSVRPYYFVEEPDGSYQELVYRVKTNGHEEEGDETYKNYFHNLMVKERLLDKYGERIVTLSYTKGSISELVSLLNAALNGNVQEIPKQKLISADVFAGGIMNFFPARFSSRYHDNLSFQPSFSPTIGINGQALISTRFNQLRVGLSLNYNHFQRSFVLSGAKDYNISPNYYYTVTSWEKISMKADLLQLNFNLSYILNKFDKVKFYFKAGINYNMTISNDAQATDIYQSSTSGVRNGNVPISESENGTDILFSIRGGWVNPYLGAGIVSGNSKIEFGYQVPVNAFGDIYAGSNFKAGSVGIYYYYTIFNK